MSGRLTTFGPQFDAYDYLPDNKRNPEQQPLYPIIAILLTEAVRRLTPEQADRLDPLIADIMSDYEDKEAVSAYFNTAVKNQLGMYPVILRLFDLLGLNLGITEWFRSEYPVIPFKFYIDIYEFPDQNIIDIINLIYRTKNERSHLLSLRDSNRDNCPGYFILDQSELDSNEYLTDAIGEMYNGVKICYTFFYKALYTGPILQVVPPTGSLIYPSYLAAPPPSIYGDGLLAAPAGHILTVMFPPPVSTRLIANVEKAQDEIYQSYHYGPLEVQLLEITDDPYAIRSDASTDLEVQKPFGAMVEGFVIDFSVNQITIIDLDNPLNTFQGGAFNQP